ncbi:MAG: hypothetical protein J5737_02655 [Bacteroidales bacterium]|nr:hypothetical protein [Bacteroidales bacterium]
MIEKVILSIAHSDAYTDYLIMTAGLTNKRIIPIVSPAGEKLKAQMDDTTLVLRCYNSRTEFTPGWDEPVIADTGTGSVRINSRFYLDDDGNVNATNAGIVRETIQRVAANALLTDENIREVFRHYFPLLWSKRQLIYDNPKLFFADSGRYGHSYFEGMPIGVVLKAMEEDPRTFRIRLAGGCGCGADPILVDFDRVYGQFWTLYTWCPACGARKEIRAWNFQRMDRCRKSVDDSMEYYNKGQGLSALSLLDVIDALK